MIVPNGLLDRNAMNYCDWMLSRAKIRLSLDEFFEKGRSPIVEEESETLADGRLRLTWKSYDLMMN
jgi:hypothetical protein